MDDYLASLNVCQSNLRNLFYRRLFYEHFIDQIRKTPLTPSEKHVHDFAVQYALYINAVHFNGRLNATYLLGENLVWFTKPSKDIISSNVWGITWRIRLGAQRSRAVIFLNSLLFKTFELDHGRKIKEVIAHEMTHVAMMYCGIFESKNSHNITFRNMLQSLATRERVPFKVYKTPEKEGEKYKVYRIRPQCQKKLEF